MALTTENKQRMFDLLSRSTERNNIQNRMFDLLSRDIDIQVPTENTLDNVTIEDINRKNQNPGNKEFFFVPGRNVNVELPKGGIDKAWNFLRRSYDSGKDSVELGNIGAGIVFGQTNPELEKRISALQKKTAKPDPLLGILPPPKEGWVNYIADAITNQIPNLAGMFHDGMEAGAAAGIANMAMVPLAGPLAPAVGAAVPITTSAAFATGSLRFAFNQIAGSSYLEYRAFTDKEGNKLPDAYAKLGAVMSGAVGTGLEALPFAMLAKIMPGVSKIFNKAGVKVAEALKFPTTTQAMKTFLFNIARVAVAEGLTEAAQEVVQIETGEALKAFADGEYEPVTVEEMWARIQEAGLKGAIVSGGISIPIAGARAGIDITAEGRETRKQQLQRAAREIQEEQAAEVKPEAVTPETIIETAKKIEAVVEETVKAKEPISETEATVKIEETLKAIAPSKDAVDIIIKGRIDKLDTDILSIDKQIDSTEKEIVQRKFNDQPVKALENKTTKLLNQREILDEQRAELLNASEQIDAATKLLTKEEITEKKAIAKEVGKEKIEVKAEKIIKLEEQSLKAQERALSKGIREGARLAKKDIKQAIKNTKALIRSTSLPKDTKDAIIAQFVTGEADFIKNIPRLQSKIASEFERLAVKEQKARIEKSLSKKTLKSIKVSGVKQGKFDAVIQVTLDNLATLFKTSGKVNPDTGESEASLLLNDRIEKEIDDPLGNAILNVKANPRTVTSAELAELADTLDILISEGREAAKARILKRQIEAETFTSGITQFVSKGKDIKLWKRTGSGAQFRTAKNFTRQVLADVVDGWDEVVDRILPESEAQKLEITKEISHELEIKERMLNRFTKAAEDAYGIKDGRKLKNLLDDTNRIQDHGIFTNNRNEQVRLEISKSEAMTIYIQWQDPTLRETLTGEDQLADPDIENKDIKGNAYTKDEMLPYIFNTILDPKDRALADNLLDIYAEFYPQINEVYSRVFGINLDNNPRYSPIQRQVDSNKTDIDVFGVDIAHRSKITNPTSLKARQNSIKPLLRRSALDIYTNHINEMSRFIALRGKTQLLNTIFSKADVQETLKARYGKDFNRFIGSHLESFVSGARDTNNPFLRLVNYLNRNFAASALGGKAKIGFTQLISLFAYAETIPATAFISGVREFALNPAKVIRILGQTQTIRNRGYSIDVDIARMGKVFDNKTLQRLQKKQDQIIDYMLIPIKIGDRFPIYAGGWAVYKHVLAKTGSKVRAVEAFERTTESTQQSKRIDKLSLIQKGNPLLRSLSMFMSAPIAQLRGEMRAMRKVIKGESSIRQFTKSFLIYHFILPGLYQAVANGIIFGEWDAEDQKRAAWFGSFNAFLVFGDILNSVAREIQGKGNRQGDVLKWARPMKDMLVDLIEGFISGKEGDFEEMTESIYDAFKNSGSLTGLPTQQIDNIKKGFEDLEDGELKASTLRFLGWPNSVIENIE